MKKDLVNCFYTGQDYRVEKPAEVAARAKVREYKRMKIGKFIESGKVFLFFARLRAKPEQSFRPSARTVLCYLKTNNNGDKLHYEIPMAGDRSVFDRHRPRNYFATRVCSDNCACHRDQVSA